MKKWPKVKTVKGEKKIIQMDKGRNQWGREDGRRNKIASDEWSDSSAVLLAHSFYD